MADVGGGSSGPVVSVSARRRIMVETATTHDDEDEQEETLVQPLTPQDSCERFAVAKVEAAQSGTRKYSTPRRPRPAEATTFSTIATIIVFLAVIVLYIIYVVYLSNQLDGWSDLACEDSNASTVYTKPPTFNTTTTTAFKILSSTGRSGGTITIEKPADIGYVYMAACGAIQLAAIIGIVVLSICVTSTSPLVSMLAVFLDVITLGIFIWGVILFLSASVCSFWFLKVTLVYSIIQLFLYILLVNCWGYRARTKRRMQTATTPPDLTAEQPKPNEMDVLPPRTEDRVTNANHSPSLPTLKPFQHPAFPPEAQVLFVQSSSHHVAAPSLPPEEAIQEEEI